MNNFRCFNIYYNPNQRIMNKFRREQLSEIVGKLEVLKDELEELKEEERECFEKPSRGLTGKRTRSAVRRECRRP